MLIQNLSKTEFQKNIYQTNILILFYFLCATVVTCDREREKTRQESAELETVKAALGKEFPQKEALALARENHGAVIRELQRMQDDADYVSTWEPKIALSAEPPVMPESTKHIQESDPTTAKTAQPKEKQFHTLKYGEGEGRTEYTVSNQHNGHTLDGHVLRRTYFNSQIGSLGQNMYEDGQWHSTTNVPQGVKLRLFASQEAALQIARDDAAQRGLKETVVQQMPITTSTDDAHGIVISRPRMH